MKTKILACLFAVALMGSMFTGCGDSAPGKDAQTEDGKVYQIGITQFSDHGSLDNCREGFLQGLAKEGFVEGENLKVDYQSAQNEMAKVTQIAQAFVNDNKDLVCGIATPSAQGLYAAAYEKGIPVIFNAVNDPVAAKLAVSSTQPMEGITGVSDELPVEDQLKLIRAVLPEAKTIGILYTTSEANSVSTIQIYKDLAPKYGFEILEKGITKQAEIPQVMDVLLPEVDCISNMTDNTVVSGLGVMLEKANAQNIPIFGSEEEQVQKGCIASAGLDYVELGEMAGVMAARVLRGEDISTIPFEKVQQSKITVNQEAASALGISLPDDVLAQAE